MGKKWKKLSLEEKILDTVSWGMIYATIYFSMRLGTKKFIRKEEVEWDIFLDPTEWAFVAGTAVAYAGLKSYLAREPKPPRYCTKPMDF